MAEQQVICEKAGECACGPCSHHRAHNENGGCGGVCSLDEILQPVCCIPVEDSPPIIDKETR